MDFRRIAILVALMILIAAGSAHGQFPLTSVTSTNTIAVKYDPTNSDKSMFGANQALRLYEPATNLDYSATNLIPLIVFEDVPLTVGMENLARQAGINYLLDPRMGYGWWDRYGHLVAEPRVTLRWEKMTAEHAFLALCANYGFAVVREPSSGFAFIRISGHNVHFVNSDFYQNDTNMIPVMEFQDEPLSAVLKNLAKQAHMKCILSARVDSGHPEKEPHLSVLWQNLTARQAFAGLCEDYDLEVTKYPISGIVEVEPEY
jgi:hypothetical protein